MTRTTWIIVIVVLGALVIGWFTNLDGWWY
jgi:hypothetical protein